MTDISTHMDNKKYMRRKATVDINDIKTLDKNCINMSHIYNSDDHILISEDIHCYGIGDTTFNLYSGSLAYKMLDNMMISPNFDIGFKDINHQSIIQWIINPKRILYSNKSNIGVTSIALFVKCNIYNEKDTLHKLIYMYTIEEYRNKGHMKALLTSVKYLLPFVVDNVDRKTKKLLLSIGCKESKDILGNNLLRNDI